MFRVCRILTSDEARRQWPNETLSMGEITRRFALAGAQASRNLSSYDRARLAQSFKASMKASNEQLRH